MSIYILYILIGLLIYHYLVYPLLVFILSSFVRDHSDHFTVDQIPMVSILIPAHNEALVIQNKINSILKSNPLPPKFEIIVGADACTDDTEKIVSEMAADDDRIRLMSRKERTGKPGLVNLLVKEAQGDIILFTDADVLFSVKTFYSLCRHFKDENIALVDSYMTNKSKVEGSVAEQEGTYLSFEVSLKNGEGKLWRKMMGPFGGCYAMRKSYFKDVPDNYLVDDFFIAMNVLQAGGGCINDPEAVCFEDITHATDIEFNRKARISAGNYQNTFHFKQLWLWPFNMLSVVFISHKLLRWVGPFLFLGILGISISLLGEMPQMIYLIYLYILAGALTLLHLITNRLGLHSLILQYPGHFVLMNIALFVGFIKYIIGIKSNVWQPTIRG